MNSEQPTPLGRRTPNASDLKQRILNAERKSVPFRLVNTGDIEVYVQRPSLPFLMSMGLVPEVFRKIADSQIKKFGLAETAKGVSSVDEAALRELVAEHGSAVLTFQTDVVNATVIAGFVTPPVTADREVAERDGSPYLWINDIAWEDRQAFYDWCNAETGAEAEAVKSDAGSVPVPDDGGTVPGIEGLRVPTNGGAAVHDDLTPGRDTGPAPGIYDAVGTVRRGETAGRGAGGDESDGTVVDGVAERLLMGARSDEV